MATIDPNIAMGYKPVQIENPLNQLAAYSQIQGAQQGQQMNMLKMQEYQRGLEEENKLRTLLSGGGDINSPDVVRQMYGISPTKGLEFQQKQALIKKAGLETTGLELKNFTDSMSQYRNALDMVRTPEQLLAWQTAIHKDPITGSKLASMGMPYESVKQQLLAELQKPGGFEAALNQSKLGATKFAELQTTANAPTTAMREFDYGVKNPAFAANLINLKRAGAPSTQVNLPPQEKEFEKTLGGKQAETLIKSKEGALDAASILQTNEVGRNLLKSGAITGAGADFFVGLNQALKTAGIDAGYADASANSQAYAAAMGQNTAKLIKQFGAGTGLSDADRVYAEKIAAGAITMDEKAIRKVLDINDTAARNVIKLHNKNVEGIKTNIPLKVDLPRGAPVRTGKVTSGPNAGKTILEYADGTKEYQ